MQNNTIVPNMTNELNSRTLPVANFIQNLTHTSNTITKPATNIRSTLVTSNAQPCNTLNGTLSCEDGSIFNKTCNEVSNRLIGEIDHIGRNDLLNKNNVIAMNDQGFCNKIAENNQHGASHIVNNMENNNNTNVGPIKSQYYSLLGYEFSLWTLILTLLILMTIIYFLYRWFFSSDDQIVSIKKSKEIVQLINSKDNDKLNNEISDSDNSSSDTESDKSKSQSKKEESKKNRKTIKNKD